MAPLNQPLQKDGSDRRVGDILEFAGKVQSLVQERTAIPPELHADLRSNIKRVSGLPPGPAVAAKVSAFDLAGTELWNGTTNILRDIEEPSRNPRLRRDVPNEATLLLRVFAFYLLDAAYRASSRRTKDIEQRTRNFKVALKTCRSCLERDELELALRTLERCSDHVGAVDTVSPLVRLTDENNDGNIEEVTKSLAMEYHLLRIMYAWKSGRLDLAAHFTTMLNFETSHISHLGEKAADLFFEIGKFVLKQSDTRSASEWLERALNALNACDTERLSDDAADLRLSISAKLVKCLSSSTDSAARERAKRVTEQLSENPSVGNRLAVQVMQLDVLLTETPIKLEEIQASLSRIVRSSVITEKTFNVVLQAIHRTKAHSVQIACEALSALIRSRLIPNLNSREGIIEADGDRVEKACVTFVMLLFEGAGTGSNPLRQLCDLLDLISHRSPNALSGKAVHAMQTLIWKTSESGDPSNVDACLELLRHAAFDGAGQTNKAIIGRKAILLAIQRNDLDGAREAYHRLSSSAQSENLTQYLVFKLALRCDDYELACGALESIIKHTRDDGKFLYACVLEAQESKMRHIAIAAFEALLDKQPPGFHLPTLSRCTARLLVAQLDSSAPEQTDDLVNEIVKVFERANSSVQNLKQGSGENWRAEMQWWIKNAYNLSLKLCGEAHPVHLCRLLSACTSLIDNYLSDGGVMHEDDLKRRKMLCHFLSASALIVLARLESESEEYALQCYLGCRQQVREFNSLHSRSEVDQAISRKRFELLKYDIECVFKLQQWDNLEAALQAALDCKNVDRWDTLADLILIIHSQSSTIGLEGRHNVQMITLIQRIINETWKKDKDLVKVSRWLRLSFSMDIRDGDGAFASKLLQQAADMAKKGFEGSSDQCYPEAELQWLSSTAFNRAVDFLSAGEYEASKEWMEGALEMARYARDQGSLHANLSHKKDVAMERIAGRGQGVSG